MFAESFLPNFVLFVAGQAAAWFYLRSGRLAIGGLATAALWVAADWAVVAKFVFEDTGPHYRGSLAVMQITAVVTVLLLGFERWRRRFSKTAKQRTSLYCSGTAAYLRRSYEEARLVFRRLVRTDPWDAASWLALGNTLRRTGRSNAAKRCYRRGLRVDGTREYADLAQRLLRSPGAEPVDAANARSTKASKPAADPRATAAAAATAQRASRQPAKAQQQSAAKTGE